MIILKGNYIEGIRVKSLFILEQSGVSFRMIFVNGIFGRKS